MGTFGQMMATAITLAATVGDAPHDAAAAPLHFGGVALAISKLAEQQTVRVAEPAPARVTPAEAGGLERAVHVSTRAGVVYLPRGFRTDGGAYDVVIHFHGAAKVVEDALESAGVHAALLTVNLGIGSGPYEEAYTDSHALGRAVDAVGAVVKRSTNDAAPRARRIALSAFSAGYGAVSRLLSSEKIASEVDAVLLSDGLHAGYTSSRSHTLDDRKMAPFVHFASDAARGDKLMGITHSAIPTFDYASTTETAAYLLHGVDLEPTEKHAIGARGMVLTSTADRGNLHVRGFEGTTKEAHCDHLLSMGDNLFPFLAERWR